MKVLETIAFSKTKCRVVLEDESSIVLYNKDLRRYGIENGVELSDKQLEIFMEELLPYRAKARCMKLLQSKDYTETEMRKKLQGDGYPEPVIDKAIAYLYGFRYLDDIRYVELYYRSKCSKKSRKQIIMDLQQKGISKDCILEWLEAQDSDNEKAEEIQCIYRLLMKRKYNDEEANTEVRERTKAYLFRKGFELNDIIFCMKNFDWKNM